MAATTIESLCSETAVYHPCPLCGMTAYAGNACERCFAPGEVIDSILALDKPPHLIGVLGPSGVGKTVYLGMLLDLLARGADGLHGTARGAFSLGLHRNLILALERRRFPAKTPVEPDRWQWVHCEVDLGKKSKRFDLVAPDVAGEAVAAELSAPRSNPTVHTIIANCSGMIALVDILEVIADGQGQELFAMQLISYLASLRPGRRRDKVKTPVAVVFTKSDLCDEPIHDPEAFARDNSPSLWRLCESKLERFRFFSSGVAGSSGWVIDADGRESLAPLRIEPRGIIEPFSWLIGNVKH